MKGPLKKLKKSKFFQNWPQIDYDSITQQEGKNASSWISGITSKLNLTFLIFPKWP